MDKLEYIKGTAASVVNHPKLVPARDLSMRVSGQFTVAAVGDIVMTRPISQLADPRVKKLCQLVRDADLAIGNLEQAIADVREFKGYSFGVASFLVMAHPMVARDLATMGFDLLSRANNRLGDFGIEGNRETDAHLRSVGITPFGFGEHLAAARAPVYADWPGGRVSAIGVTAITNHNLDAVFGASARVGMSNGRPGANYLRVARTVHLPAAAYDALRALASEHDYAFPGAFPVIPSVMIFRDRIRIGSDWYMQSNVPGYSYEANESDVADILKNVRNAAYFSNFCVVSVHTHQWMIDRDKPRGGLDGETQEPPDFLTKLARQTIDNGADMFCAHGPFEFRAIEIYKGKPIFYGLGSFVRQAYMQEALPWDMYRAAEFGTNRFESVNPLATDQTDAEILFARTAKHPKTYFEGLLPICHFRESRLDRIELHPTDLGFSGPICDLGTPRYAERTIGDSLILKVAELSSKFGTKVSMEEGLGVVRVSNNTMASENAEG